jgi:hypothetical protein
VTMENVVFWDAVFLRSVRRLLVTANVVPSSRLSRCQPKSVVCANTTHDREAPHPNIRQAVYTTSNAGELQQVPQLSSKDFWHDVQQGGRGVVAISVTG